VMLKTVASTADQNPTAFVDGGISMFTLRLPWGLSLHISQMHFNNRSLWRSAMRLLNFTPPDMSSRAPIPLCSHFGRFLGYFVNVFRPRYVNRSEPKVMKTPARPELGIPPALRRPSQGSCRGPLPQWREPRGTSL
jgi:hypothetical protein